MKIHNSDGKLVIDDDRIDAIVKGMESAGFNCHYVEYTDGPNVYAIEFDGIPLQKVTDFIHLFTCLAVTDAHYIVPTGFHWMECGSLNVDFEFRGGSKIEDKDE